VQKFNSLGQAQFIVTQFGNGPGQLGQDFGGTTPQDVAVDPNNKNRVYIADNGHSKVSVFDSSGSYLVSFGTAGSGLGQFSGSFGVAGLGVDPFGCVYVADPNNHRVDKWCPCIPNPTFTPTPLAVMSFKPLKSGEAEGISSPTITPTPTVTPTATPGNGLVQNVVAAPNLVRGNQPIKIQFNLNHPAMVHLSIFTLTGEQVFTTTVTGNAGANTLTWEANNLARQSVASGLYVYVLQVDDGTSHQNTTGKVVIIR
jgi:hypothetical protein